MARANAQDVDLAVQAAKHALHQGEWKDYTPSQREKVMRSCADKIEENVQDLAILNSIENGKPIGLSTLEA